MRRLCDVIFALLRDRTPYRKPTLLASERIRFSKPMPRLLLTRWLFLLKTLPNKSSNLIKDVPLLTQPTTLITTVSQGNRL